MHMKTFSLTGDSALSPSLLRAGLLDPATWRGQDATVESAGEDSLAVSFPLAVDSVPEGMSRFLPDRASLRMEIRADAEAPAGSPQTAHLTVTVPGAPVEVRVAFTADPATGDEPSGSSGSTIAAHAQIESSVPLFGPMIESALEPIVRSQMREKFDQLADLR